MVPILHKCQSRALSQVPAPRRGFAVRGGQPGVEGSARPIGNLPRPPTHADSWFQDGKTIRSHSVGETPASPRAVRNPGSEWRQGGAGGRRLTRFCRGLETSDREKQEAGPCRQGSREQTRQIRPGKPGPTVRCTPGRLGMKPSASGRGIPLGRKNRLLRQFAFVGLSFLLPSLTPHGFYLLCP